MPQRILLVDDDPTVTKWAKSLLTNKGYEVITAQGGQEALRKLKMEQFDLIILDILMPDMDGYQVCNKIRSNDAYQQVPIIFLTVKDKELDDSIIHKLNIEYIQKPAEGQYFLGKIEEFLSKEKEEV